MRVPDFMKKCVSHAFRASLQSSPARIQRCRAGASDCCSRRFSSRAVSSASASGAIAPRASHADFDIVTIDPAEDPEQVAQALVREPAVEYAQVVHRLRALFVPNDPLYASTQWNLPMINMEKAWDIQ